MYDLDNADIRALSKKLLKEFGSKYDEAALTDELQIVFDYIANNRGNIDVDGCMEIFPNGDARLRHEEGYKRMKAIFEKGFIKVIVAFTSNNEMLLYDIVDFTSANFKIKNEDVLTEHSQEAKFSRHHTSSNTRIAKNDSSVNTEIMQDSQNNSDIKKSLKAEDDAPSVIDRYYAEAIRVSR